MKQINVAPPPLPPKVHQSPPAGGKTVLSSSVAELDHCYQQVDNNNNNNINKNHVVKIHITPSEPSSLLPTATSINETNTPCIRISVNKEMIQTNNNNNSNNNNNNNNNNNSNNNNIVESTPDRSNYFFYNCGIMSSGQVSPSDTLDSGTCSDLDGTPPPLLKKKTSGVSVTIIKGQHHNRVSSLTSSGAEIDSDDNESNLSCDSLNSGKLSPITNDIKSSILPQTLLHDIRQRNRKSSVSSISSSSSSSNEIIKSYEERKNEKQIMKIQEESENVLLNTDMYYNFHLNEHWCDEKVDKLKETVSDDVETFAGYKDLLGNGASTIRSAKGTVRGVKNRVRAGIATFLQINSPEKSFMERDAGKVVVYTTTMGIVRHTHQQCMKVKQILRTLLVKFEERDLYMSSENQVEIRERIRSNFVLVPQVFVNGQHIGNAETIEKLNESGELRRILRPYKSMDVCTTCKVCGGYRLLPCQVCNGSKKSVHRNHFTAEFVALKCMNCDEVGLVKCNAC